MIGERGQDKQANSTLDYAPALPRRCSRRLIDKARDEQWVRFPITKSAPARRQSVAVVGAARSPRRRKKHQARGEESPERARARQRACEAPLGYRWLRSRHTPGPVRTQRLAEYEVRKHLAACPRANPAGTKLTRSHAGLDR